MLEKYFKIIANLFYDCYKCLRMLTNPYELRCKSYERVANETTTRHMRIFAYTHCRSIFLFLFAGLCPISLFPIILMSAFFHYTTRISMHMLAKLYKCLPITTNASPLIRKACELLPNMLRICIFTNFMNLFLEFAKSREWPRMYTNTKECQTITMRPLRFVTELPRYYVNDTIRNMFAQV